MVIAASHKLCIVIHKYEKNELKERHKMILKLNLKAITISKKVRDSWSIDYTQFGASQKTPCDCKICNIVQFSGLKYLHKDQQDFERKDTLHAEAENEIKEPEV